MSLVKVRQNGSDIFINSDNVLILSPSKIVNHCGAILVGGVSLEIDGTVEKVATALGYKPVWVNE